MGILATIAVRGYTETRTTADINIETDMLVAQLREARGQSQNTITADESEGPLCRGFLFEVNQNVKSITMEYGSQFNQCPENEFQKAAQKADKLPDARLVVSEISVNGESSETSSLAIFYYPPKGEFLIFKDGTLTTPPPEKIQISTRLGDKENSHYLTILSSGVIQKEQIHLR